MGYRSDIVMAFVFRRKEQIEEVMAIYRMDENVQKYDLEKQWQTYEWDDLHGLVYYAEYVKWYESFGDMQGLERMATLVSDFGEERGHLEGDIAVFPFAYTMIRIGEEDTDIVTDAAHNDFELLDVLYDRVSLRRSIETSFA